MSETESCPHSLITGDKINLCLMNTTAECCRLPAQLLAALYPAFTQSLVSLFLISVSPGLVIGVALLVIIRINFCLIGFTHIKDSKGDKILQQEQ